MTGVRAAGGCALLLLAGLTAAAPAAGQAQPMKLPVLALANDGATSVLDVPFVPQSPALCGGAAVAMVLRYYGERGIYADDFAALVVASGEGIRTDDLAVAVRQRGWLALPFAGAEERAAAGQVQGYVAQGRPVIALIEDRPGRFHYVVVVGWADGVVVLHDPARGPLRRFDESRFQRAWATTSRWAMLVLPDEQPTASGQHGAAGETAAAPQGAGAPVEPTTDAADACRVSLDAAVLAARTGGYDTAERALLDAAALCPDRNAVTMELAGLRFRQQRYAEAAELASGVLAAGAQHAGGRNADARHVDAWDLLASSRYLLDDADGALRAWNRIGRPRKDLTRIDGARATPFHVLSSAVAIPDGAVLTHSALARARRRVSALPTVQRARVDYRPVRGGDVEVHAAVAEQAVLPLSIGDLIAHGVRALADDRVRIDVTNALAAGEAWLLDWVWQGNRRSLEAGLAAADAFGVGGVWQLHFADRRLAFHVPVASLAGDSTAIARESQRAATLAVSDWISGAVRWRLGGSLEEWSGRGAFAGAMAELELRAVRDRFAVRVGRGGWWRVGGSDEFHTTRWQAAVRSAGTPAALEWSVRAGMALASDSAPRGRWYGAGHHFSADALLRAHPLVDGEGVTTSAFFGTRLVHAGAELRRWIEPIGPVQIGAAVFVDAARVHATQPRSAGRTAVDVGTGLRLRVPGIGGAIRADAALGLTDGATALSLGWAPPWPAW